MIRVNIISGFLGAGKTTFIKRLIQEAFQGEKLVLIENEFGEIGIDGEFLKDAGIEITEMNSGCICCTLVGDFGKALRQVMDTYAPDRILIEPSGVGKLSDVIKAVRNLQEDEIVIEGAVAVVDGKKAELYLENFGEFYENQVRHATTVVLSRTQMMEEEAVKRCVSVLRRINGEAPFVTTEWSKLGKDALLGALEGNREPEGFLRAEEAHAHGECCSYGHEGHFHAEACGHGQGETGTCKGEHDLEEHGKGCCGNGHHHSEGACDHKHPEEQKGCCGHGHHHSEGACGHKHPEEQKGCCGNGRHHSEGACDHKHSEEQQGCCGHGHHHHHRHAHDHHHHHHHHADEVFTSWGKETVHRYTEAELEFLLKALSEAEGYGTILRAKGILQMEDGGWKQFDLIPGEYEVREGKADYTGRFCVIGTGLAEEELGRLFCV